jgi:ABC-type proline/glycine betaine transport system ATPase subunit
LNHIWNGRSRCILSIRPKLYRTQGSQERFTGNTPILETDHLSREVGGVRIVDDVTVEVRTGEVLVVVGPSGAGKSSFLRLLNRLDEPTSGTVWLEGIDYREIPPRELRRRVGMVTQTAYLFPGTIADNLRFGPQQQGIELPEKTIEALLLQVGLTGRAREDVTHLSGGEAQRVSVARALATTPEVLLLDEPTSALDAAAKDEVEKLILTVARQNELTCVMVSHDLAQAARVADRVMVMSKGKLEKIATASEVINAEGTFC